MGGFLALIYVALVVAGIWLTVALWRAVFRIAKASEESVRLLRRLVPKDPDFVDPVK